MLKPHAVLRVSTLPEVGQVMVGRIYNDTHTHGYHPFQDGTEVYTTRVIGLVGNIAVTCNTVYQLEVE